MSRPIDLPSYINERFPGLSLGSGLFYRWPIGIRFALGGRDPDSSTMALVNRRAVSLYEAMFAPADDCVLISEEWSAADQSCGASGARTLFTFAISQGIGLQGTPRIANVARSEDPLEAGICSVKWIVQPARSFRYDTVLNGIANADHAIEPSVQSAVYFYNLSTDAILHMYDDRGLDAIATRSKTLLNLYCAFNDWILDYDRTQIDRLFDEHTRSV